MIIDHGQNDPLEFAPTESDRAIARISREAIEANRLRLNQMEVRRKYEEAERNWHRFSIDDGEFAA